MTDDPEEIIEEYTEDCRIVFEERDWYRDQYHFECQRGRIKSFENPTKARLYADVYESVDGFREDRQATAASHQRSHAAVMTC